MKKRPIPSEGLLGGAVQAATAAVAAAAKGTAVAASAVRNTAEAAAKGTAGAAGAVAKGTVDAAGAVAKGTADAAGTVAYGVAGAAGAVAKGTVDAAGVVASGVAEQARAVDRRLLRAAQSLEKRYYHQTVSPVVEGQGGDFGTEDGTDILNQVVLNMEIVGSDAVKRMQNFALLLSLFAVMATIALCVLKYKSNPSLSVDGPSYFEASVSIAAIFLAALLITFGVFVARVVETWRSGRVWSRRRAYVSSAAFIVLSLQILNLLFMVAGTSYALAHSCGWRDQIPAIMGYLQWTCWNVEFTVFLVLAHNGCTWRGKTSAQGGAAQEEGKAQREVAALVLDAPLSVHALKLLFVVIFQAIITVLLWSLLPRLGLTQCENLTHCKPDETTIICIALLMAVVFLGLFLYLYFAWRADADIKCRPYAEMRFARMVFSLQHDQIRPCFVSLALCMVLLASIRITSCWSYVETW